MPYPPNALATNRQNATPTADTHPNDHNSAGAALNLIVKTLGDAGVVGPFEDNGTKFADVKAVLKFLFDQNKARVADLKGLDAVHTIRSGSGAPSAATGHVGDWYINTSQVTLYGPKSSSATNPWGSPVSLVGPKGADSNVPGPQGKPGANGADGKDGVIANVYEGGLPVTTRPGLNFVGASLTDDPGLNAAVISVVTEPVKLITAPWSKETLDVQAFTQFFIGPLTGPLELAFANRPVDTKVAVTFVIELWQGVSPQAVTWPAGMHWNGETSPGGAAPALSAGNGVYKIVVTSTTDANFMGTVAMSGVRTA